MVIMGSDASRSRRHAEGPTVYNPFPCSFSQGGNLSFIMTGVPLQQWVWVCLSAPVCSLINQCAYKVHALSARCIDIFVFASVSGFALLHHMLPVCVCARDTTNTHKSSLRPPSRQYFDLRGERRGP